MKARDLTEKKRGKPEIVAVGNVSAKVYHRVKKGGYDVWEVADYSTGRRKLRSFSDHAYALKEATRIATLTAKGEVTALDMRPAERASFGRAIELLRPTGTPIELAAARYAEAFQLLGGDKIMDAAKFYLERNPDKLPTKSVEEVISELLANRKSRKKSNRYLQDLKNRLGRFADAFKVNIANVMAPDVQKWLDGLKVESQTYINYRRVVYTLFSYAENRGYIFKGSNPAADTEQVDANNGAVEIYSPAEMGKLLAAASPDYLPCLALGGFAGLRSAEVERLTWGDIDLARGIITVEAKKAKTRSRRTIPISTNLAAWLASYANKTGPIWKTGHDAFYDAQQSAAAAAGITWKPNALRHSFASYRLQDCQDAAKVSLELGNSPSVVFKHYRELTDKVTAEAWFAITPARPTNIVPMAQTA